MGPNKGKRKRWQKKKGGKAGDSGKTLRKVKIGGGNVLLDIAPPRGWWKHVKQ